MKRLQYLNRLPSSFYIFTLIPLFVILVVFVIPLLILVSSRRSVILTEAEKLASVNVAAANLNTGLTFTPTRPYEMENQSAILGFYEYLSPNGPPHYTEIYIENLTVWNNYYPVGFMYRANDRLYLLPNYINGSPYHEYDYSKGEIHIFHTNSRVRLGSRVERTPDKENAKLILLTCLFSQSPSSSDTAEDIFIDNTLHSQNTFSTILPNLDADYYGFTPLTD